MFARKSDHVMRQCTCDSECSDSSELCWMFRWYFERTSLYMWTKFGFGVFSANEYHIYCVSVIYVRFPDSSHATEMPLKDVDSKIFAFIAPGLTSGRFDQFKCFPRRYQIIQNFARADLNPPGVKDERKWAFQGQIFLTLIRLHTWTFYFFIFFLFCKNKAVSCFCSFFFFFCNF